jgi:hypothetical protein
MVGPIFKGWEVGSWFVKTVFVSCVNTVYIRIRQKALSTMITGFDTHHDWQYFFVM